jgi:hypothetical protein
MQTRPTIGTPGFDPSAPAAARWRAWLGDALADRRIPPDASLELRVRPHGEVCLARMLIDLRWVEPDAERHAHAEVLIPIDRVRGAGWAGWPAYAAGLRLLRSLG